MGHLDEERVYLMSRGVEGELGPIVQVLSMTQKTLFQPMYLDTVLVSGGWFKLTMDDEVLQKMLEQVEEEEFDGAWLLPEDVVRVKEAMED